MPNITLYLDDEAYLKFNSLEDVRQRELRQKCISLIEGWLKKKEVNNDG